MVGGEVCAAAEDITKEKQFYIFLEAHPEYERQTIRHTGAHGEMVMAATLQGLNHMVCFGWGIQMFLPSETKT